MQNPHCLLCLVLLIIQIQMQMHTRLSLTEENANALEIIFRSSSVNGETQVEQGGRWEMQPLITQSLLLVHASKPRKVSSRVSAKSHVQPVITQSLNSLSSAEQPPAPHQNHKNCLPHAYSMFSLREQFLMLDAWLVKVTTQEGTQEEFISRKQLARSGHFQ